MFLSALYATEIRFRPTLPAPTFLFRAKNFRLKNAIRVVLKSPKILKTKKISVHITNRKNIFRIPTLQKDW